MTLYQLELTACHNKSKKSNILYISEKLDNVIKIANEIIKREKEEFNFAYKMEHKYEYITNDMTIETTIEPKKDKPYERVSVKYISKKDNSIAEERFYNIRVIRTDELLNAGITWWF